MTYAVSICLYNLGADVVVLITAEFKPPASGLCRWAGGKTPGYKISDIYFLRRHPIRNTLTGEGLAEVLNGASVVVDVSNSPSFEDVAVMNFFQTSTRNLLSYEAAAGGAIT